MHHCPSPVTYPVCQQQQYEINLALATPLTEFEGATLASGNISRVNAQGTLFTPFASGAVQVVPQAVPEPGSLLLLGTGGLGLLATMRRRKKQDPTNVQSLQVVAVLRTRSSP